MTKNQLMLSPPPTQMAHDLNEPKNSEKIPSIVTTTARNTNSDSSRMPHSPENGDDAIDCAIAAAVQKDNHHELISVANGSQATKNYENGCLQSSTPTSAYHKDGHYFLKLLQSEKSRLLTMADQAERDMCVLTTNSSANNEISDEIFGILRSVSGKTKLLVSQKFKQFEGLCHSNLNPTPDEKFPTTTEDLLGFWDMVNLQIEHIDSLFKELDLIKANNWQPTKDPASPFVPTGSRVLKKSSLKNSNNNNITPIKTSPNALLMAQKRDMQRKQLLEMKRKNKSAAATDKGPVSSPIEIYVTENVV
ncbi:disks large-associated protein 1-like isoform X2 [Episyrphus balteatus]|nr:disks large-associated protein 1-like isoform X2 [Episyrphus balteatus]